jgi:hypothetical protein
MARIVPRWLIALAAAVQATWDSLVEPVDMEGGVFSCESRRELVTLQLHQSTRDIQRPMQ